MNLKVLFTVVVIVSAFYTPAYAADPIQDGNWTIDTDSKTVTWTGVSDGSSDIALTPIAEGFVRGGYVSVFEVSVPGRLVIITGTVDGNPVSGPIDALPEGRHEISSIGSNGGFRWQSGTKVAGGNEGTCPPADGVCWSQQADGSYVWTGATNGDVDIHQGDEASLAAIRGGAIFTFSPTVSGTLIIDHGQINDVPIAGSVNVSPGNIRITSPGESGGFRWTPLPGIGWRNK